MIFLKRVTKRGFLIVKSTSKGEYFSMMKRSRSLGEGSGVFAAKDLKVLYQDDHFIAIDKPFDVRMDGDMDVTVEKLLLERFGALDETSKTSDAAGELHNESKRGYKWVHQLDYATSGTLLVALDRQAAASATKAFSERRTYKEYLAIVYGHVSIRPGYTRINKSDIKNLREQAMSEHHLKTAQTVTTEHPQARYSTSWQDACRDDLLAICIDVLQKIDLSTLPKESDREEIAKYQKISLEEYHGNFKLRKRMRKLLKNLGLLSSEISSSIAASNTAAADATIMNPDPAASSSYSFQHSWPAEKCIYHYHSASKGSELIWINIPIAEVPDQFPCEYGHENSPGRYAETEVEILGYGRYMDRPVTKLRLIPHTGRRHQLRLHCLALGHPIVGDCTYAEDASYRAYNADRMMLHSLRLQVPIEGWWIRGRDKQRGRVADYTIDLQTADPYDGFFEPDTNSSTTSRPNPSLASS
jgi:23S rRNA-/tRNA-specific pseudouridylate synthase